MTKNLTLILALLLSVNVMECRASSDTMLNDIITSDSIADNSFESTNNSEKIMVGKADTGIERKISSIKDILDNINTNIKNISDRQQNDIQIKFNKEIDEAYETFWNEIKEFNQTHSNSFVDPAIAKHIKNNSSGIGSFFNIVDDPVKCLANFALTKGLEFYQFQKETAAAKIFLDLNNTDSVSSYSNVQTKFYEIYI